MNTNSFLLPGGFKKWTLGLLIVGIVTLLFGFVLLNPFGGSHGDNVNSTRFWAVLLQNSLYWLLLVNTSMFFICISTLAMGGWQVAMRRVPEAISGLVPILGVITLIILLSLVLGHRADIYPWVDRDHVANDNVLRGKAGFLSPGFYIIASLLSIGLWSFIGMKIRQLSTSSDSQGHMDFETGKWIK